MVFCDCTVSVCLSVLFLFLNIYSLNVIFPVFSSILSTIASDSR